MVCAYAVGLACCVHGLLFLVAFAADKLLLKMATRKVRPLQDFSSWPSFGTATFWHEVDRNPEIAQELMCRWVNGLGCINPTEPTSASIASHSLVAQYGFPQCLWVTNATAQDVYESVKAPICTRIHVRG
jgi:hypothetical protein